MKEQKSNTLVDEFERQGFVIIRSAASSEAVATLRSVALHDLAAATPPVEFEADIGYPGAPLSRTADGGVTVRRLLQAYHRHPVFADWARSPIVVAALKALLGDSLQLSQAHHNCVMTKQPQFSSLTAWHQDIRYWSFAHPELISAWLALGEERPENGCLSLLPGSHQWTLDAGRLDSRLFLREDLPQNHPLLAQQIPALLDPGDVLLFHCRAFHAASSNRSAQPKLSLVFTYHAESNLPLPGTRSASLPEIHISPFSF